MRQLIWGCAIALVTMIFAIQNAETISVTLFFWDIAEVSVALLIILCLMIGIMIGLMFMAGNIYRKTRQIDDRDKRIRELERLSERKEETN